MTVTRQRVQDTLPATVICVACGATVPPDAIACASCGRSTRISKVREPGTVLGSYRVIETLGEGGMGIVYLAEHTRLGRRVAIKMLRSEFSENRQAVRRFFSEARAVNRISHPNIVEITDFIENPGADNYYVMELLRGVSLAALIDGDGVQPLARTAGIMAQVAAALEAVHGAGIIHRDLKPDNVFLVERGGQKDFAKLLDFGVAKLADADATISLHQTAAGAILGTPEYMSPEQASGKAIDTRSDIYSFGVMLYELVTGKLPLTGTSFGELVVKHLTVSPRPPSKVEGLPHVVPASLEDLILACLAKEVDDRPATIATVSERLHAIADAEGWVLAHFGDSPRTGRVAVLPPLHRPTPPESVPVEVAPPPPRRRHLLLGALAAVALVAVALVALGGGGADGATTIAIELETNPAGAEVFRAGETVALGRTPFSLETERSDRNQIFELRLAGHETATYPVRYDRSTRITATLKPLPVEVTPPAPPAPIVVPSVVVVPSAPATKGKRSRNRTTRPATPAGAATAPAPAPAPSKPVDRSGVLNPFEPR